MYQNNLINYDTLQLSSFLSFKGDKSTNIWQINKPISFCGELLHVIL